MRESGVLQACEARPACCFITMSSFLENKITRQLPRRHPTLLTDYLKAVASKKVQKKFISRSSSLKKEKKKSLHYKQLIYKDAATDQTLYVALCISVDTWMER